MSAHSVGLAERAAGAAQVLVADLDQPVLSETDQHHLSHVLRLRAGEIVVATDGRGGWVSCRWTRDGALEQAGEQQLEAALTPSISVGFALTKGDKPELVVQKLTELGVDVIRPLISERTIVRWDAAKAAANSERFRRVAHEAAMQSRRVWLPEVLDVAPLAALDPSLSVLAQAGGHEISAPDVAVVVGPEGGWSPDELAGAARLVDLGPTILRAETAAVAVGVRLCGLRWARTVPSDDA